MPTILIVDDEADILDLLEYNLAREGFEVLRAIDGEEALKVIAGKAPDIILLDIMMPKMDGVETCKRIRSSAGGEKSFIIFLTARSEEYSELAGFEAGADDYISKPIKPKILVSRIKAVIRRNREGKLGKSEGRSFGDLRIVKDEFLVYKNGKPLNLPKKEFELLLFLSTYPGKVFSRDTLLEKIWGDKISVVDRTVDVHVRKLREKIGQEIIQTIKGVGYKFVSPNGD